jgi:hypothetical protein
MGELSAAHQHDRDKQSVWKKSYLDSITLETCTSTEKSRYSLEEVSLGVRRVNTPPVVGEHVEDAEDDDKERGGPFGLETDGDHDASSEPKNGDKETCDAPLSLENESEEQEDE